MEAVFILAIIFAPFFYWLKRRFDYKEKALHSSNPNDAKLLEGWTEERKLLVERIEILESIVCNSDYELSARIAQVAAEQSRLKKLGPKEDSAATDKSGDVEEEAGADEATAETLTSVGSARKSSTGRQKSPAAGGGEFEIGSVLSNRYRVERLLGRGGMGAVYLAHDEVLSEDVALKVVSAPWSHDHRAMVERFRREVSAARKVSSPNVIRIHDLGETPGGLLFVSMEYFPGQTLAERIAGGGRLSNADAKAIFGQICDGLTAAHDAGVIHRDLKPQNVLVGESDEVKLIDFGLAKSSFTSAMTATGLMMGTPHYMSPEQIRGTSVDVRTDIYALGAVAYLALTGQPPFDGDNPIAICFAHLSEAPKPPRHLNSAIERKMEKIILAALNKDPKRRPSSAGEFRKAL